MSEIIPFLNEQTIFMTGVTGFLGKVLLHKLFSSASPKMVYVLIRSNKNAKAEERLEKEVFEAPIFHDLMRQIDVLRRSVKVIEGDITENNFGISEENRRILQEEVTVIIHSAATTKFNENLKLAVEMNVLGVERMLTLAKTCQRLISVVHVSTAYVNCHRVGEQIEEKVYPNRWDPESLIGMVKKMSLDEANDKTPDVITPWPNTYTFTKSVGEKLVEAEKDNLPICVIRPSIVTAALREPIPGWVDVMLGPAGLFVATGMGVLRAMHGSNDTLADFIPVDLVCNAIIVASWYNSISKGRKELPIFHINSGTMNPLYWDLTAHLVPAYFRAHVPPKNMGPAWARFVKNKYLFKLGHIVCHVIPAGLIDCYRMLIGKKAFMLKACFRLHAAISSLSFFTLNSWYYLSNNTEKLLARMTEEDYKVFLMDAKKIQWDHYFITMLGGIRRFLIKEQPEKNEVVATKQHQNKSILSSFTSVLPLLLAALCLYLSRNFFRSQWRKIQQFLFNLLLRLPPPVLQFLSSFIQN